MKAQTVATHSRVTVTSCYCPHDYKNTNVCHHESNYSATRQRHVSIYLPVNACTEFLFHDCLAQLYTAGHNGSSVESAVVTPRQASRGLSMPILDFRW